MAALTYNDMVNDIQAKMGILNQQKSAASSASERDSIEREMVKLMTQLDTLADEVMNGERLLNADELLEEQKKYLI